MARRGATRADFVRIALAISEARVEIGAAMTRLIVQVLLCWLLAAVPGFAVESQPPQAVSQRLFDGKTLAGWAPSGFEGEGGVKVVPDFADGRAAIVIEPGVTLSGVTSTMGAKLPRMNYEVSLEAMKIEGDDFFCGVTFPVGPAACTFVVGGWGGMVVGISSIDGLDASENETTEGMEFAAKRWYRIRVRVTPEKIEAWIDGAKKVDVEWQGRKISLRPGDIQRSLPLGIATYMTEAAVRDILLRQW